MLAVDTSSEAPTLRPSSTTTIATHCTTPLVSTLAAVLSGECTTTARSLLESSRPLDSGRADKAGETSLSLLDPASTMAL